MEADANPTGAKAGESASYTSTADCQVSFSFHCEGKSTQHTPTATQLPLLSSYQFTPFYLTIPNLTNCHAKVVLLETFCSDGLTLLILNTSLRDHSLCPRLTVDFVYLRPVQTHRTTCCTGTLGLNALLELS